MTPDVNVLVAAFRSDHPQHFVARRWFESTLEHCVAARASVALLPMVLVGFLRIVTSSRVFKDPDRIDEAMAFLDALLGSPGVELSARDGGEWPLLRAKLVRLKVPGNLVSDAWIAAAVQARSEHLVTFDRDFVRLLSPREMTVLEAG